MNAALDQALMATPCMDADHPAVKAKAAELIEGLTSVREQAVAVARELVGHGQSHRAGAEHGDALVGSGHQNSSTTRL